METVKKSFTPPANNPLLLPDIALPVFLAISFPQKRERLELQGRQHIKKDYPRGAGLRHRYCGAVAVTLLCGERSGYKATYPEVIQTMHTRLS